MQKRKKFLFLLPAIVLLIFIALEILSHGAAEIFNRVIQNQDMLRGKISVETIKANIFGEVEFTNFIWLDSGGETIIEIPEGSFKVKIVDIVTKNFKADTIQELTLKNANVSLNFDENMQVDFIRHSGDFKKNETAVETISRENLTEAELKKFGEMRRKFQQQKIETGWKNFNLEGRKIKLNLKLENCRAEIFYRERHYLFGSVNLETKIDTTKEMTLKVRTRSFGGTMIGKGMEVNGKIDFKSAEIPQCNLTFLFKEVDPSSLGIGMNIHDTMTLLAKFTGPVNQPVGDGKVTLAKLNIPGISFENVEGKIHYEDADLIFTDVFAEVYGGNFSAHGDYNIDTRFYNIYGYGEKLKAAKALPNQHLHCDVDLEITIKCAGNAKKTTTFGQFYSGRGRYSILYFDDFSGKFKTDHDSINFYDVTIKIGDYKVSTDALSIEDKKLTFAPINITNENGQLVATYTR